MGYVWDVDRLPIDYPWDAREYPWYAHGMRMDSSPKDEWDVHGPTVGYVLDAGGVPMGCH